MKLNAMLIVALSLLTCHRESVAKSIDNQPTNCLNFKVQKTPTGIEVICDGVPYPVNDGKDGAQGPAGHNGGPGQKGDQGEQGPPGTGGRSIVSVVICHLSWDGVPKYELDYQVFTYSDGIKESSAIIENKTDNEIYSNSSIWIKEDPRASSAPLEIGDFVFRLTSGGALVLYRSTGRTSDMVCH